DGLLQISFGIGGRWRVIAAHRACAHYESRHHPSHRHHWFSPRVAQSSGMLPDVGGLGSAGVAPGGGAGGGGVITCTVGPSSSSSLSSSTACARRGLFG